MHPTQGAEPLFFLDYFASGKLDVTEAAAVVGGIAKGCAESNCALLGGETAEMPGMYGPGHYDLAGFAVGAVGRAQLLPKLDLIAPADVLIGLPSSGVHSNGFSLVRKCVEKEGLGWDAPAPFDRTKTLAQALLTPTRLYVKSCLPVCRSGKVKALAHITGGGETRHVASTPLRICHVSPQNPPRVLPAEIVPRAHRPPRESATCPARGDRRRRRRAVVVAAASLRLAREGVARVGHRDAAHVQLRPRHGPRGGARRRRGGDT